MMLSILGERKERKKERRKDIKKERKFIYLLLAVHISYL